MLNANGATSLEALRAELIQARSEFLAALTAIDPAIRARPGLVGDWSERELIAHLGYWAGHATEAIHAVELGRDEEELAAGEVEARNQAVARVARGTPLATVEAREAASFAALLERLERLDPTLLSAHLAEGDTLEEAIREDGPDHYREHAADLHPATDGA